MTFIVTLIALIIERFFHWGRLRHWRWFYQYQRLLISKISNWSSYTLLAISILPLLIIVGLIDSLLGNSLHGILKIIFGVLVLLYCMGPDNLWLQTFNCLSELHKEDPKLAIDRAQSAFGIAAPENSQGFHHALVNAIFINANKRVLAVVFWFVVLGPVGAVLYRSVTLCAEQSEFGLIQAATTIERLLDWVPVRLFSFFFALGGHFMEVFKIWKVDAKTTPNMNDKLMTECGVAALDIKQSNSLPEDGSAEKSALELLDRVLILGLVLLALMTLAI